MLNAKFIEAQRDVLLVSFSPSRADGKFFLFRATELAASDCWFFEDTEHDFYVDHYSDIVRQIDETCQSAQRGAGGGYRRVVVCGFSAGAFAACYVASKLATTAPVDVHAFSPHIHLSTPYSSAQQQFSGRRVDLSGYSLVPILAGAPAHQQFRLYFSTDSARDGIHVRESIKVDNSNARRHYLTLGHDTHHVLRHGNDYDGAIRALLDGTFHVPAALVADAGQLVACLTLADVFTAEMSGGLSRYTQALRPRDHSAEHCYWHSRQLARQGRSREALEWGWAAITKSDPRSLPPSFPETLGHIAFDDGHVRDALSAYQLISNPNDEVAQRITLLQRLVRNGDSVG